MPASEEAVKKAIHDIVELIDARNFAMLQAVQLLSQAIEQQENPGFRQSMANALDTLREGNALMSSDEDSFREHVGESLGLIIDGLRDN
ncbi:hypothetical protein A8B78_04710 [Jannaschia sp. EhC01]|nr:hypothetical protein A8B78_04710 [Jannaschia sp. EhC01]